MVETNDTAERTRFPRSGLVLPGSPERQAAYYRTLLSLAREHRYAFVISFVHQDYDGLWEKIKATAPDLFIAWKNCGLLDGEGNPRLAYGVWRSYFSLPLR